ncbi:MAG: long-chain-fatty-acid--CoA ligase [Gammaproteobacteria bacterium]
MQVPLLVDDFLKRPAAIYPGKTAIVDGELRFTYAQYNERVNRLSNALLEMRLKQGDRVCILSPNSHFFMESFYATSQLGLVLVPLNYRLIPEDHAYIIDHAGVKAVLADYEYVPVVDQIRDRLPSVEHWIAASYDSTHYEGWADWNTVVAAASADEPVKPSRDENDLVSINYTSGTTARPKGVMLTHRNVYINAYNLIASWQLSHNDVDLWTLPMFHCNGWGGVYALTGLGATHVILRTIDAEKMFELIAGEKVTFACMAPTILRMLLDYEGRDRHSVSTKPRFVLAGAPPPVAFIERLEEELGWHFLQIYGLTETAPLLTSSQVDHATDKADYGRRARAGVPGLGVDLQLLDDNDAPVPKDNETVGEVCVRSNVVFSGYWQQQEETEKCIYGGYFHTGDLAVWDEFDNIHIVDRKKDVIISGGENISSPDIEDVLYRYDGVLECAVIGVPSEKWGETPKALVVLREGIEATEEEIIQFCRDNMAHFKCPTSVEFIDELPRTVTGKLQKFKLRERYWGDRRRVQG